MKIKKIFIVYREKIYIFLGFSMIGLIFTWPIFWHFDNWGILDWDQHLFYHAVPRLTILDYNQPPLWNPYYCGGTVLLANPQSRFLSPSFIFILLFGEVRGIKIEIWFHVVVGLLGTYLLARHYKLSKSAAILSALVFTLNSMYAVGVSVGMTWWLSVAYVPWAFVCFIKSFDNWKYALASGLSLALIFLGGGAYILAITLLFLAAHSLWLVSFKEQRVFKVGAILSITLLSMLCVGAIKFFPAIAFIREHPRFVYDFSGFSLNSLRLSLFGRDQTIDALAGLPQDQPGFFNGVSYLMDENGMYIGLIPFILFLIGIGLRDKRRMFLFLSLIVFLWISFGNRPRVEVWSLLHLFPVYDSMRVAQRFKIIVVLCLSILAGFGLQTVRYYLRQWISDRWVQFVTVAILSIVFVDLTMVSRPVFQAAFPIPPLEAVRGDKFYQIDRLPRYDEDGWNMISEWSSLYLPFLLNIGSIDCYETANVPRKAVPISSSMYQGEFYLKDTEGTVTLKAWSPNRFSFEVNVSDPGYLILNQNYYPGWQVNDNKDRTIKPVDDLLAIPIFPEDKFIEISYYPSSFILGAILTTITILFWAVLFIAQRYVSFSKNNFSKNEAHSK